jgi:hypothetical protein
MVFVYAWYGICNNTDANNTEFLKNVNENIPCLE